MNRGRTERLLGRKGRLRAAVVAPVWRPGKPKGYAGIERVTTVQAEELRRRGADVTLFAGPGTPRMHGIHIHPATLPMDGDPYDHIGKRLYVAADIPTGHELDALSAVRDGDFDIALLHNWPFSALAWTGLDPKRYPATRIQTFHGPLERTDLRACEQALAKFAKGDLFCHGISDAQMSTEAAKQVWDRTIPPWRRIYNPLHLDGIRLCLPPPKDEVQFVNFARVTWIKGQAEIAKLCYQHSWRLNLHGSVAEDIHSLEQFLAIMADPSDPHHDHEDFIYFRDEVLPYLGDIVKWHGPVINIAEACDGATAYLNAIMWDEPFGLAPMEAAGCGIPVITIKRGALGETVHHGENGILCADMAEFEKAMGAIATREVVFNHRTVRRSTLARFHPRVIGDQYVEFWQTAMELGMPMSY